MAFDAQAFAVGQNASGNGASDLLGQQMQQLQVQAGQTNIAAAQQQMAMQRVAMARQQQYSSDVQSFAQNPTVEGLASLWKYPEFQANTKGIYDAMDPRMRQAEATQLGSFASVLQNAQNSDGTYKPEMLQQASQIIQQRIDADKAAGRDTTGDEQALQMVQSGDPKQINAVKAMTAGLIAGAVGFDHAKDWLSSIGLNQEPIKTTPGDTYTNPVTGQVAASQPSNLTSVTTTNVDGSTTAHGFNPQTGLFDGGAAGGSGAPATQPGGGGQASGGGAAYPAGTPRSVRNNNPGNLRASPFTKNQPGFTGVDNAGYATFSSPEAGQAAQAALLAGSGYYGGGRQTVASIIQKWAPSKTVGGDNTPAQQANYIKYVAQKLGVSPAQKLSPAQLPQLAQAMSQFEAGATGNAGPVRVPPVAAPQAQSAPPGGVPAPVNPAASPVPPQGGSYSVGGPPTGALDTKGAQDGYYWADGRTHQLPIPGGKYDPNTYGGTDTIRAIALNNLQTGKWGGGGMAGGNVPPEVQAMALKMQPQILAQAGLTPEQAIDRRRRYIADANTYQTNTNLLSSLTQNEGSLYNLLGQVRQTQQKLVDMGILGHSPDINRIKLNYYEHAGSQDEQTAVNNYRLAINGAQTDYAKFMSTQSGSGNAPSTDAAMSHARTLIDEADPQQVMLGGINQLQTEAKAKRSGIEQQNNRLSQRMDSYFAPKNGQQPQNSLPAGARLIGTYQGRRVIELNGQRLVEQ